MGAFALTSTGFTNGSAIPTTYACAPTGMNLSPDLTWTNSPTSALSYAVILTDKSNDLIHWVIWDIPSNVTSLPQHIAQLANPPTPAGAKQVKSYDDTTFGYLGPCPPSTHTYQFAVYALDVATLPTVTTSSTRADVEAAVMNHDLASATLTGTYTP
jgi:Raf kinase inhibitor-like YbhB/YbcL family protein